jgi:hypothetical protein
MAALGKVQPFVTRTAVSGFPKSGKGFEDRNNTIARSKSIRDNYSKVMQGCQLRDNVFKNAVTRSSP